MLSLKKLSVFWIAIRQFTLVHFIGLTISISRNTSNINKWATKI